MRFLFQVWVEVPMIAPTSTEDLNGHYEGAAAAAEASSSQENHPSPAAGDEVEIVVNGFEEGPLDGIQGGQQKDTWHWFYEFRRSCNNHRRLSLLLELTADLPESKTEIARWKGEPIAAVKLDTRTFLSNRGNFPVLSKAHQELVKEFFLLNLQCVVDGPTLHVRRPRRGSSEQQPVDPTCLYYAFLSNLWKVSHLFLIEPFLIGFRAGGGFASNVCQISYAHNLYPDP